MVKTMKRACHVVACAVLITGLCGCDELVPIISKVDRPDEIVVGVVMSLTGEYAVEENAQISESFLNGFHMARDEINSNQLGPPHLRFTFEDDRSTKEGAVEAYNKLILEDQVTAIIGPAGSNHVEVAFPVAQEHEIVAVGPTSAARGLSALGDFVFRVNLTVDKFIPPGVRITHENLMYQRVAMLVGSDDVFTESASAIVTEALGERGVDILTTEWIAYGEDDYRAELTRIKDLAPDAVFVLVQPTIQANVFVQSREVGISEDVQLIVPFLTSDQVEGAGKAAEGAITFTAWTNTSPKPESQAFVRDYRAKYNLEPTVLSALTYTSVHLLMNAISDAGAADSFAIRDALAATRNTNTVLGSFSFDEVGDAVYDPVVLIVKNGALALFE